MPTEFEKWMRSKGFESFIKRYYFYFKRIYKEVLAARNEKILIVTDYGLPSKRCAPLLAGGYLEAAKHLNLNAEIITQGIKEVGKKAEQEVINKVKSLDDKSIVIICSSNKLGKFAELKKTFRRYASERKFRYITTPSVGELNSRDIGNLLSSIDINYEKLRSECKKLKQKLDWARTVRITTSKGTNVKFDIKGRTALSNDGNYFINGKGGNIPCGEVYIPPRLEGVSGKIVVDLSSRNKWGTSLIRKPITLKIERGFITDIQGNAEANLLARSVDWTKSKAKIPSSLKRIGELGIGMNINASVMGAMIIDEKCYGTSHVGIGSNFWFGGEVISTVHLDQVFDKPRILIDDKEFKFPSKEKLM